MSRWESVWDGPVDFGLTQIWNWSYEGPSETIKFTRLDLKHCGKKGLEYLGIYQCSATQPVKLLIGNELIEFADPKPAQEDEMDLPDYGNFFQGYVRKPEFDKCFIPTHWAMLAYTTVELVADRECELTFTPRFMINHEPTRSWLLHYPFELDLGKKCRISKGSLNWKPKSDSLEPIFNLCSK